jgi:hypothetical protein
MPHFDSAGEARIGAAKNFSCLALQGFRTLSALG